jgi:hypothetical protein
LRFALSLQHKALAIKIVHNEKSGFIQIDCHTENAYYYKKILQFNHKAQVYNNFIFR